ncbi:MAG: CarD family transcriptional regulator [Lachnospiraceae bacterium]|nr:CarD family transcriptional regulator [Lachnospiraceae bacterium]
MYQVNDLIVYGNHGVCRVTNIGTPEIPMADQTKQYYTLRPAYQREEVIYAPVENNKTVMRPILTRQEADQLIDEIPKLSTVWIVNEREREAQYKAAIRTCDCKELVRIIKTLYQRKRERIQSGKKVTVVDERYFHQAEEQLYGELAIVLDMPKDEVGGYIAENAQNHEAVQA